MAVVFDTKIIDEEFWSMMTRMNRTLDQKHFALNFTGHLRRRFREQISESFMGQGPVGDTRWFPLSEMRVRERGGTRSPILVETGDFWDETSRYKGEIRLISSGFSYWFPQHREMSGRYWGLTAGQLVNPLGPAHMPLALVPRRVLGGRNTQERHSIGSLVRYFTNEGWEVSIGD